jgi:FKBP-type peptidyl-prolyl cis-trans isomerase FkpA
MRCNRSFIKRALERSRRCDYLLRSKFIRVGSVRAGKVIGSVMLPLSLVSCEREAEQQDLDSADVAAAYAPALQVDLEQMTRHESGLHVQDVRVGEGDEVRVGDMILVHYTGWLADGTEFDSSRHRNIPLDVAIGTGDVIRGWDEGVPGMRVGGQRRLIIPPALGYGAAGAGGVIPPGATLIFDIEVVEIVRLQS